MFIAFLAFITGQPAIAQELSTVVEWTDSLRLEEPEGIYTVSPSVRIDSAGFIVTDFDESEVRLYTRSGKLKLHFGRKGSQAPGALRGPSAALRLQSGQYLVPDVLTGNLSLFSEEGNFVKRHTQVVMGTNEVHDLPGEGVLLIGPQKLAPGSHPLLHRFLPETGTIKHSFFPHPIALGSYGNYLFSTGEIAKADVRNNTIVATFALLSNLYFFDIDGTLKQKVTLSLPHFQTMEKPDTQVSSRQEFFQEAENHSEISNVFWLNDNIILLEYSDIIDIETRKVRYNLAAVTPEGEVLFDIPDTPQLFAVDPETQELFFQHPDHDLPNHWIVGRLKSSVLQAATQ